MNNDVYTIPDIKKVRVIIDTDAACECDDQYAIAHALMSQKVKVCAIIAEHFGSTQADSMKMSLEEIKKVVNLMGVKDIPILKGASTNLTSTENIVSSKGADKIIDEAMKDDKRPLFVINQGPVTNLATALLMKPEIASRLTAIWIGGKSNPSGGFEFNMLNDVIAANTLLQSDAPVWMIPQETYTTLQAGLEELYLNVAPYGAIGKYLFENTVRVNKEMSEMMFKINPPSKTDDFLDFPNGGSWAFGDSAAIGLLLSANSGTYTECRPPMIKPDGSYETVNTSKKIRMYDSLNTRYIMEDFYSKLKVYYHE